MTAPAPRLSRRAQSAWRLQVAASGLLRTCRLDHIPVRRTSSADRIVEHWLRMATWRVFGPGADTVTDTPHGSYVLTDGVTPPSGPQVAGLHDAEVAGWVYRCLRPGATVIDVGANVGYFTVMAARKVGPGGRLLAVEPIPSNVALLERNLALNGFADIVTVVEGAAVAAPGPVTMHRSSYTNARGSLLVNACATGEPLTVAGLTLDALADTHALTRVDLVKIDAEGADLDVLLGARDILTRHRPRLVVEFWPRGLRRLGRDPGLMFELVREHGYRVCADPRPDAPDLVRDRATFDAFTATLANRNYGYANLLCTPRSRALPA